MRRAWLPALATLVLGLLVGALVGLWADQALPAYVPAIGLRQPRGQLDEATFDQALRVIQGNYYESKLDYSKLSQGSVRGLVQALGDPHSSYLDPAQYKAEQDSFAGRHTGLIGVYVTFNGEYPAVSGLIPGSPAARAGIRTGDLIVAIDGQDARGLDAERTAALIRGPEGGAVTLDVQRDGQRLTFQLRRETFSSPMVVSLLLDPSILYMRVYQFGTDTTTQFDEQLQKSLPQAHAVVLDLRDNPGGYIAAATAMISRFVSSGEAYELRDREGHVDRHDVAGDHPAVSIPVLVLVNANTASAAEIVAGSLQARHRARLIGAKTYGKGSVQQDYVLRDGSDLHLTVEHWFLPDGRSIDGSGLQPDESVSLPSPRAMFDAVQPALGHADDAQLNRALQELSG